MTFRAHLLAAAMVLAAADAAPARAQDAAAGEKVFLACKACHQVGETARNGIGPTLNGVVGRKAASVAGYNYSEAMKNSGLTWDAATLAAYNRDPKGTVPGTKMVYAGLKDDQKLRDLQAYLEQFQADGKKK